MENIPKVKFNKGSIDDIEGVEIIELNDAFFNRKDHLDHSPYNFHRVDFYAFIFIHEGEVNHKVDFETCKLKVGQCLFISSGQIHAFDAESEYNGTLLLISETFMQKYISEASLNEINHIYNYFLGVKIFDIPDRSTCFVDEVNYYYQTEGKAKNIAVAGLISLFLVDLMQDKEFNEKSEISFGSSKIFSSFISLLKQDLGVSHDAHYYADKLSVSYKQLNIVCKEVAKLTLKAYINSFIILEAKRYLTASTKSAKEISFDLGFDEPTNFSKFFKKYVGESPVQFRNNYAMG